MNHLTIQSDFVDNEDYRLLAIDASQYHKLRTSVRFVEVASENSATLCRGHKRMRDGPKENAHASGENVALVLKGAERLIAHDETETYTVRRVEYSNSLLLAHRRLHGPPLSVCSPQSELTNAEDDPRVAGCSPRTPFASVEELRRGVDSVVVASLARLFEAQKVRPSRHALALLHTHPLTIEELEADDDDGDNGKEKNVKGDEDTVSVQHMPSPGLRQGQAFTFSELAHLSQCSPKELAEQLVSAGAVVHKGKVRLLSSSLLCDAVLAALTFFDAAEPSEMSWSAAEAHFCPSVYPPIVIRAVRATFAPAKDGKKDTATAEAEGVTSMELRTLVDPVKVLVALARHIFDTHPHVQSHSFRRATPTPQATASSHTAHPSFSSPSSTGAPMAAPFSARHMRFDEFFPAWLDLVPPCLWSTAALSTSRDAAPDSLLRHLRGYVVCQQQRAGSFHEARVWWLEEAVLPEDTAQRLAVLFEANPTRWEGALLRLYVEPLLEPQQLFEHVIHRYAREFRIPGEPISYAGLTA